MIDCEPATWASLVAGAGALSVTDGFSGGRLAAACFVSGAFGAAAVAFGSAASGRGDSCRLASITFGFAGALAVVGFC